MFNQKELNMSKKSLHMYFASLVNEMDLI